MSVPDTVARGALVPITLRLRNTSATPAEAHFVGRTITFDIVVRRRDGTIAWQRLGNAAVPSILQIRTLAPGETMEWTDTWRASQPGGYEVQGVLPSDDAEPRRTPWQPVVVR